jgi:hypothetical protein
MKKTFVESYEFTEWVKVFLSDDVMSEMQRVLQDDPDAGSVMPGCGGLRKVRVADLRRGKGKRGGARIIYLHVAEADIIYLLDIYSKDEKEDLTANQKKVLKEIAARYKEAAVRAATRDRRGK